MRMLPKVLAIVVAVGAMLGSGRPAQACHRCFSSFRTRAACPAPAPATYSAYAYACAPCYIITSTGTASTGDHAKTTVTPPEDLEKKIKDVEDRINTKITNLEADIKKVNNDLSFLIKALVDKKVIDPPPPPKK